jgi:triacylglycerol lipase
MYTTTWGPANPNAASNNSHIKEYVMRLRAFVEAVIKYTGAPKVNIIGHSMGVTLGRKVIKGGIATDHSVGNYDVGPSLKDKVNTFVGLAGANLGLTACWTATTINTCNTKDGFFPGALSTSGPSVFLADLNKNGGAEGDKVYTIWSKYDDLILYECVVWGKVTCRIPGQTGEVEKTTSEWGHFAVRDNTGPDLIGWL